MARIRSIKPDFWEDEGVGLVSRGARLLFIATWNLADDEGLLRWSADYLKAQVFPYDTDLSAPKVAKLMAELVEPGFVFPYVGGRLRQQLAYVVGFHRHQRINRPQPSKFPPPSLQSLDVRCMYGERDRMKCGLCGEDIMGLSGAANPYDGFGPPAGLVLSIDHKIPLSKGGSNYPSNLHAAHISCNKKRGNRSLPESLNDSVNDAVNDSVNDSLRTRKEREKEREVEVEVEGEKTLVERCSPRPLDRVFEAWQISTGHTRAVLDPKRRRSIVEALKVYPEDDVLDAVRGWVNDSWPERPRQNGLHILLRDAEHIEKFRDLWRKGETPTHTETSDERFKRLFPDSVNGSR